MLPQKNFENLHAEMAVLVLLENILFKICDPKSEYIAKYNAFCLHIFDYACLKRKAYIAVEEIRNY